MAESNAIAVVDISPLENDGVDAAVADALLRASADQGFIYIRGHGIEPAIIDAARNRAFEFFRADPASKQSVAINAQHRGWLAQGGARMQDDQAPDLKESFLWGYQDVMGQTPSDHPLRGPNVWPAFTPDLQPAAMAWFAAADRVARRLLRAFARGLGQHENFFLKTAEVPLSRASCVYYPPRDVASGAERFGVGPHTDFGVLTLLAQDDVGGLQIEGLDGEWIDAPPIDGTLVVNVGDLLARWSAGRLRSTPHRVVNRSARERLSLVLAFDPDPNTRIDARELSGEAIGQAEAPITCGDYLVWRFGRAFGYRQPADHD